MRRKEFIRLSALGLGGLAWPGKAKALDLEEFREAATSAGEDAFWQLVRQQFALDPQWTFLNFGGLGACPLPVLHSFSEWSRNEELAPNAGHDEKEWWSVKERLAALLGKSCRKEDLALISGATEGVNLIINGLPLKKGDEIITSTHEHVAVNTGLLNRMERDGIVPRLFEPDLVNGLGNVERIARLINDRTRLILISHVTCTTGQRFPDKEIARLAHDRGIWFALDGAQAPGCILFDIVETGADFYTCSTHKWIMAPKRTAFLYVRQGLLDTLRPLTVGGGSTVKYDMLKKEMTFQPTAQRYEYGTQNDALFYALGTAVDFVRAIGLERIWSHNRPLAERFYRGLMDIPGVEVLSPREEAYRSVMVSFRMKTFDYKKVNEHLLQDKLRVRTVTEGGLNAIRVSFHICNTDEEVTKILESLKKLAASA